MDIGANSVGTSGPEELPSAGVCVLTSPLLAYEPQCA